MIPTTKECIGNACQVAAAHAKLSERPKDYCTVCGRSLKEIVIDDELYKRIKKCWYPQKD